MTIRDRIADLAVFLQGDGSGTHNGSSETPVVDVGGMFLIMKTTDTGDKFFVMFDDGDEDFFAVTWTDFWSIDSEAEREIAMQVAAAISAETKTAKVLVTDDDMYATVETFSGSAENTRLIFWRTVFALQTAVNAFTEEMRRRTGMTT